MAQRKITLIRQELPETSNINDLIQWYGASLGLFSPRDKDSSCFRIFVVLLKDIEAGEDGLRSEVSAERTGLSRGTVVHHLNKLQDKGLVAQADNEYFIKVDNLNTLTSLIREEMNAALDNLERVADDIDDQLGLNP